MPFDWALPSSWQWATIEQIQAPIARPIVTGPFGSSIGSRFFVDEGVPVIRGNNLSVERIRFIDDGFVYLTEEKAAEFKNLEAHPGDLVFTAAGTIGQVGIIPDKPRFQRYIISNKQMRARLDTALIEPLFAYYWFTEPYMREHIISRNTGSTIPLINLSVLRSLPIPLPPLETQREFVQVLGALDDKIALLRETSATLEAIAQALFKSWFVDFDPVRAKAEGRDPIGVPPEVADLFPSEFEDLELGEIPKGWRSGTLANIAQLNSESWTARNHPSTVSYIDLANTKDNVIADVPEYAFDEAPSRARRVLRDGDTVVGTVRPGNRSFAYIHEPPSNLTASTGFAVLRPTGVHHAVFLYLAATQDSSIEHLAHVADGAAYPAVRPEVVAGIQCTIPSDDVMRAFHYVASPMLWSIADNHRKAETLASLRDTLLPRLMSGKLRIPAEGTYL